MAIIGLFVFYGGLYGLAAAGQHGGDTFFSNPSLASMGLLAGISGVAGFVTGLAGIIWRREHAVPVWLATLIGLFVVFFIAGEFISPH